MIEAGGMVSVVVVGMAGILAGCGSGGRNAFAEEGKPEVKGELVRPPMTEGEPAPGRFVRQVAEEYRNTQVHHGLYLPTNWRLGGTYPVIVEYAPNRWAPGRPATVIVAGMTANRARNCLIMGTPLSFVRTIIGPPQRHTGRSIRAACRPWRWGRNRRLAVLASSSRRSGRLVSALMR